MKRTYIKGCEWCGATGFVHQWYHPENLPIQSTTSLTNTCPVCKGTGTILVTEEEEIPPIE